MVRVTETIISCMSAPILGPLSYRYLENEKITFLRLNKGNVDGPAKIRPEGKQEPK